MTTPVPAKIIGEARQLAVAACASDIQKALRARADALNMPREVLDEIGGFTDGYASKILADPPMKGMSLDTMLVLAGTLGVAVALVEDPTALERTRRHKDFQERRSAWLKRRAPHWRNARLASMMHDVLVTRAINGGRARWQNAPEDERKAHARRMAQIRWRKWRKERRLARERERAQESARRAARASGSKR